MSEICKNEFCSHERVKLFEKYSIIEMNKMNK